MPPSHPRPQREDSEPTGATFLTADIRPLIRAASPAALHGAHDAVARHLRQYLTGDPARRGADGREPACLQPAIRLCRQADKAAAATLLLTLSTTNHTSGPAAPASPDRLRATLLGLTDAIDTLHRDADTAATSINATDLAGLHATTLAVIAAARLHRLAVRTQVIHLLHHLWNHLDPATATTPDLPATIPDRHPGGEIIPLN